MAQREPGALADRNEFYGTIRIRRHKSQIYQED
jgi:hypothetical protein